MKTQLLLAQQHPVIRGHQVHGRHLLPGLAYIDLLYQAFREHGHDYTVIELRNLLIYHPLEVAAGSDIQLSIEASPSSGGASWRVEVWGREHRGGTPAGAPRRYATATMHSAPAAAFDETIDLEGIRRAAVERITLDEVYAGCRRDGLLHTGLIKADGTVHVGQSEIWIECTVPPAPGGMSTGSLFHPTLLDGCVVGATRTLDRLDSEPDPRLLLPLHYASFRACALLQEGCIARTVVASSRIENDLRYLSVDFFDTSGRKVAELKDFAGKRVRDASTLEHVIPAFSTARADIPAPAVAPAGDIGLFVRTLIAQRLDRRPEQVDSGQGYYEMGLKSSQLLEIAGAIAERLGIDLPPTLLFEHASVAELTRHLAGGYGTTPAVAFDPPAPAAPAAAAAPRDTPFETAAADQDIAIIGMTGRYPQAADLAQFWDNLQAGRDCVGEIPPQRWDGQAYFDADGDQPGKTRSKWGGFIDGVDEFDPLFFNISPHEARTMDPQERLFLQAVWTLLETAGHTRESLRQAHGGRIGVYVGAMYQQYASLYASATAEASAPVSSYAAIANRVSFFFGFEGPSIAVDTMCSSGAVAIHMACEDLRAGRCDVAVVGAVNLSLDPRKYIGLNQMGLLASHAGSRSFAQGDGFIPAEGVGAVLLKPLRQAAAGGDGILAVIKSTATNHNGHSGGYTVPSLGAQARLVQECLARGRIDPRTISYVEAAASGSALGDPIEVAALDKVFRQSAVAPASCAIGSVKSNIGHAEAASGMSQLAKVVLQMRHRQLVPSIKAQPLNPGLQLDRSCFRLQSDLRSWPRPVLEVNGQRTEYPLRALINSFGAGGSNASLVVEEYLPPGEEASSEGTLSGPQIAVLSARSAERLRAVAGQLAEYLERHDDIALPALAFTLQAGREAMQYRAAFVAQSPAQLLERIRVYLSWPGDDGSRSGELPIFAGGPAESSGMRQLLSGPLDETVARALVQEGRPEKIARYWTQGGTIDWAALQAGKRLRTIALPTYPFARERYWLPDGACLPSGVAAAAGAAAVPEAPSVGVLSHITGLLSRALEIPAAQLKIDKDLGEYGLDSILGMRLARSLEQTFRLKLTGRMLLEHRTIAALARHVEQSTGTAENAVPAGPRAPLSENQKGLWALHQMRPNSGAYNIPLALRVSGAWDGAAFEQACRALARQYPVLDTVIAHEDGVPYRRSVARDLILEREDVSAWAPEQRVARLKDSARRPFSLERGPLWRVAIFETGPQARIVLLVVHHLICDAHSLQRLVAALFGSYRAALGGMDPEPGEPSADYGEFVRWEQAFLSGIDAQRQRSYWLQHLKGPLPLLELPTDAPRTAPESRPDACLHPLPNELCRRIAQLCKLRQITPAILFLGLYQLLLHRYTGGDDIIVGMPAMGRPQPRFDAAVGYFANVVAVRSRVTGDRRLHDFLKAVQLTVADAIDHAGYPFARLVRDLKVDRASGKSPVFQAAFEFQSANAFDLHKIGRQHRDILAADYMEEVGQEGEYDMVLEVLEQPQGFLLKIKYDAALRERASVERMFTHYAMLLQAAADDADRVLDDYSIVPEDEAQRLLARWNDTAAGYPRLCVHERVQGQAQASPDAWAVTHGQDRLSYRQLDECSTALGAYLQGQGVGPDVLVPICVERSPRMMVGLLGILKAGGAYVPLDPEFPAERLRYMLGDCRPALVLAEAATAGKLRPLLQGGSRLVLLDEAWDDILPAGPAAAVTALQPHHLAYVLYTSGSTGHPKGVMVTHGGLANLLAAMAREPGLSATDTFLATTTYCFDIAAVELFLPLVRGAQVRICGAKTARDAQALRREIAGARPTVMQATPTTWSMLFQVGWMNEEKVRIFCGGEAISEGLRQRFVQFGCEAWNMYGPTETTVYSIVQRLDAQGPITIGRPVANTQAYVVDKRLRPVPIGITGELCIAGDGVARGYLNQPALTAEKFVDNPFTPGTRLYRTGDLARWCANGTIEFLGRADEQVKIRGIRIELGDIESSLANHPGIAGAAVAVQGRDEGKRLMAWYVPATPAGDAPAAPLDSRSLREHLKAAIPDYMVPSNFVAVPALPLTGSGKVDRQALLSQFQAQAAGPSRPAAPLSAIEKAVLSIWRQVLAQDEIQADDGFFDIGGDSLSAITVSQRISSAFRIDFTSTSIFEHSSVRRISRHIAQVLGADALPPQAHANPDATARLPDPGTIAQTEGEIGGVAIVGISCHFPGAQDHRRFWYNLRHGKESLQRIQPDELRAAGVREDLIGDPNYVAVRSTITGKDLFDPKFFNISGRDAELMDPQLRLLLIHSWKAVEDAGYVARKIPQTSVFMSASNIFYQSLAGGLPLNASKVIEHADSYVSWLLAQSGTIPTLISNKLGFKGASVFLHSNCSSSLVGLHAACNSILSGEARQALVGAATLFASERLGYLHQEGLNFSSDGHLRAFDAAADGMVAGEGVAVVMLKKAADAIADGDHIYALLRGVAVNNDGADKAGFYAPSVQGQAEVIRKVLDATGIDAATIGYVEAHGTGTRLGDPVEMRALQDAYRVDTPGKQFCGIGSVKTNIGHLDTAAGLAGCIKLALSLTHGALPPSLHYHQPNAAIDFDASPFYVVDRLRAWPRGESPRRAALSSFGIGGTNTHAILEEAPAMARMPQPVSGPYVIPVSAKGRDRLNEYIQTLRDFLGDHPETDLAEFAYTLQVGREPMASRVAFVVDAIDDLPRKLGQFLEGGAPIEDCFQAELRPGASLDDLVADEEEAALLVDKWIEGRKLARLAQAWTKGLPVAWERLYSPMPLRMSLPTYPFAAERYWIRDAGGPPGVEPSVECASTAQLHPLVQANTSDLRQQRFSSLFSGQEFFLADHVVQGQRVLPGAAHLEMARAAIAHSAGGPPGDAGLQVTLKNIAFVRPVMAGAQPLALHIALWPVAHGEISYEIFSGTAQDEQVHSQGTGSVGLPSRPELLDLPALRAACAQSFAMDACYEAFERLGFAYGPAHRGISALQAGTDGRGHAQVLARIALPACVAATRADYVLHPSVLDAALQAPIGLLLAATPREQPVRPSLPFAIEELEIIAAPPAEELYAWVRYSAGSGPHDSLRKL
ncbi:MAG: amino acid adenylation domain-containing protein, partial [Ramlibacter sp.]|nr:amino acid adenylation domain-containing protein [Ramlibacter sp.]